MSDIRLVVAGLGAKGQAELDRALGALRPALRGVLTRWANTTERPAELGDVIVDELIGQAVAAIATGVLVGRESSNVTPLEREVLEAAEDYGAVRMSFDYHSPAYASVVDEAAERLLGRANEYAALVRDRGTPVVPSNVVPFERRKK